MTSVRTRRIVLGTMLACLILPIIFLGVSPVDIVHGQSPLFQGGTGIAVPNDGVTR